MRESSRGAGGEEWVPGKENRMCKGLESEKNMACLRKSKKAPGTRGDPRGQVTLKLIDGTEELLRALGKGAICSGLQLKVRRSSRVALCTPFPQHDFKWKNSSMARKVY